MLCKTLAVIHDRRPLLGIAERAGWLRLVTGWVAILMLSTSQCLGIESTWTAQSGSWQEAVNWTDPVPNGTGDTANLVGVGRSGVAISLDAPVTLGQLRILGNRPFALGGIGPLTLDQSGEDDAQISVVSERKPHSISAPLRIADDQLVIDLRDQTSLELSGGFEAGQGDLRLAGGGLLILSHASPLWDGRLTIDGGEASIDDHRALGTSIGATRVNAGGTLRLFDNVVLTEERIELDGGTLVGRRRLFRSDFPELRNEIDLLSSGRIESSSGNDGFTLAGQIRGSGDLTYGLGFHSVLTENTYTGVTTIGPGHVDIRNELGLGSPQQGTTVLEGGSVRFWEATSEPIELRGGEVRFDEAATGLLTLESGNVALRRDLTFPAPIALASTDDIPLIEGDGVILNGGVTGTGDLQLRGTLTIAEQGLSHDGGLIADGGNSSDSIVLDTANSYTGPTSVVSGRLVVNHAEALGLSQAPVEVFPRARLTLNAPTSAPLHIAGILEVTDPLSEFSQPIVLKPNFQSSPSSAILGVGTFNGEIFIDDEFLSDAFLLGGAYNGVVSGRARRLNLGEDDVVSLNAANTYEGVSVIRGDAPVEVNTPLALGSSKQGTVARDGVLELNAVVEEPIVVVQSGRVEVNVQQNRLPRLFSSDDSRPTRLQTVAINGPSHYGEAVEVNEGRLEINADTTLGGAAILNNGEIRVAAGSTLQIDSEELVLQSGSIDGQLGGPHTIRKITTAPAVFRNLAAFDGELVIEGGITYIETDAALGSAGGATRVAAERNAVLHTRGSMTIEDDLLLENAAGIDSQGGLFIGRLCCSTPTVQLRGDLDLGSEGSIVASGDSESTGDTGILQVHGRITGGDLVTAGRRLRMEVFHRNNLYTGKTDIRAGFVELARNGRLRTTSEIVLHEAPAFYDGTLLLNNSLASVPDRIRDSIPITFRGGELLATGGTTETLGAMTFLEGSSSIDLTVSYNSNDESRQLTVASLFRETGAIAAVEISPTARLLVEQPPSTSGGILPWLIATTHRTTSDRFLGFGQLTDEGIVGLEVYQTDIDQSTPADNVLIRGTASVNSDATVHSLSFEDSSSLALAGRRLVVESGGLLMNRSSIVNGQVTAGAAGNYELIVHNGRIEADIVDHPDAPIAVTTTGGTVFSGNNTYSGGTYVNEQTLYLATENALPEGTDLQIVGGEVHIGYVAATPKHLGQVRIVGDGALTRQFTGQRGHGIFSFDRLVLEEGEVVPGQLVGDGDVFKETLGNARIAADSRSTYSGAVTVNQGRLDVSGLSQASFVVNGGKLVVPVGENSIRMAGGELGFDTLTGVVEIESPSQWIVSKAEFEGLLIGSGDLAIRTDPTTYVRSASAFSDSAIAFTTDSPDFSGDVQIHAANVTVLKERSLGTGEIHVGAGGSLRLRARFGGPLVLHNTVHLSGGEVRGIDNFPAPQLAGNLYVDGDSFIRDMSVAGTTHLADGSRLTAHGEGVFQLLGDIRIGGAVEFEYGLTQIGPNAADVSAGVVQLLGTIASDAEQAVLHLTDRGLDELVLDASYHVAAGQELQLRTDGRLIDVTVSGAGKAVSGSGRLLNPVQLSEGAAIRPGSSPGTLTLGASAALGPGAIYQWQINDAVGAPGESMGWDLLQVAGELLLAGVDENPWVLEIIGLDLAGEPGVVENFDPLQNYEWLIASADAIQGWDPAAVQIVASGFGSDDLVIPNHRWSLSVAEGDLLLTYEIPEPSTALLAAFALALCVGEIRGRC